MPKKKDKTILYVFTGVCIALCVVLPFAFHTIPNAGAIFCPMHIPVIICGLVCGYNYALVCGVLGPLLSMLAVGMPTAADLPSMMAELAVYGAAASVFMKLINTKNIYADIYISLILSMLCGRIVAGVLKALIFARGDITFSAFVSAYFVTCLPGIIVQLIFIPAIYFALVKAKIVPFKYPLNIDGDEDE